MYPNDHDESTCSMCLEMGKFATQGYYSSGLTMHPEPVELAYDPLAEWKRIVSEGPPPYPEIRASYPSSDYSAMIGFDRKLSLFKYARLKLELAAMNAKHQFEPEADSVYTSPGVRDRMVAQVQKMIQADEDRQEHRIMWQKITDVIMFPARYVGMRATPAPKMYQKNTTEMMQLYQQLYTPVIKPQDITKITGL